VDSLEVEGGRKEGIAYLECTFKYDTSKGRLELASLFPLAVLEESALGGMADNIPWKGREKGREEGRKGGREGGREGRVGG